MSGKKNKERGEDLGRFYSKEHLLKLHRAILTPRLIEERMLLLLRKGGISKWFSGMGQEAISVGATMALREDDYILPLHRNLGVFTSRGVSLERLFSQFQMKMGGFTKGRDRTFHFGSVEHRIVGMISHLGAMLGVADGLALAARLRESTDVAVVFCGDGATSEGDFHEALNVAAVWQLPVLFVVENNGYGLSTPVNQQYRCSRLSDRAHSYGMKGLTIDGNDLLLVHSTVQDVCAGMREDKEPVLLECETFRVRGHEEASGVAYVPKELIATWQERDPVFLYERYLVEKGIIHEEQAQEVRHELKTEIESALDAAMRENVIEPVEGRELRDVYAPNLALVTQPSASVVPDMRFVDAVADGLRLSMKRNSHLVIMGQDVAEYGGVFKITEGFLEEFGADRVRNTPLCESAIVGAALGLSISGYSSVVEMQFSDFVTAAFTQIINNLAKTHYRWGHAPNVVIRMPTGAGVAAGPFHSQSTEAWFVHTPGLKVVYPAFPRDAKGLLIASIEDPNPVMFFEHKALYRSVKGEVPTDYFSIEIGKGSVISEGDDFSIITYGLGVHWAMDFATAHPELSIYLLDLRSLQPLDYQAIEDAATATGRVLVLHEATLTCGVGAEVASYIAEHCFEALDAPVVRCASLDTPVPAAAALEMQFLASHRLEDAVRKLLEY